MELRSPKKSGGGGLNMGGGGGGAIEGGGGINISPSTKSGTDTADPLDNRSPFTAPLIFGLLKGGRTGTLGVGTLNPCTTSEEDVKCFTVGLFLTLAVPDSGMADESNTSSTLSISLILILVSKSDWFFRPKKNADFFIFMSYW